MRNPAAVRPWQHVLDPLAGYLRLAEALWRCARVGRRLQLRPAHRRGGERGHGRRAGARRHGAGVWRAASEANAPHEAGRLALEVARARALLGVAPRWPLDEAVRRTMRWYRQRADGAAARALCEADLDAYESRRGRRAMSRLQIEDTPLAGLKRVRRARLGDARGFLARLFCADELRAAGWSAPLAQVNHTRTLQRGSVRGLHFQRAPHAEKKLVQCLRGEVWDVALDLRRGSPTFLQWHAETLSGENGAPC